MERYVRVVQTPRCWLVGISVAVAVTACGREAADWERARQERSVEAVQVYVEKHGNGAHAEDARGLLAQVQQEQAAWQAATAEGTDEAFRRYIAQFPDSRFREQAGVELTAAIDRLIEAFEAEFLVVVIAPPHAVWRGPLAFSADDGGFFTGRLTFVPPDPTEHGIVVAVLDDHALVPGLEAGRAYIWRGGTTLIDWRDVSAWDDDDDIAAALGFDPSNSYLSTPPAELITAQQAP